MSIPTHITREQMREAIKPLCDLLGTSPRNFYSSPGMTIANDRITFTVPVKHEEQSDGRAPSTNGGPEFPHPQDPAFADLAYCVTVVVVDQ